MKESLSGDGRKRTVILVCLEGSVWTFLGKIRYLHFLWEESSAGLFWRKPLYGMFLGKTRKLKEPFLVKKRYREFSWKPALS